MMLDNRSSVGEGVLLCIFKRDSIFHLKLSRLDPMNVNVTLNQHNLSFSSMLVNHVCIATNAHDMGRFPVQTCT